MTTIIPNYLYFTFRVFLHIFGMAETRVFKFCTKVSHIKKPWNDKTSERAWSRSCYPFYNFGLVMSQKWVKLNTSTSVSRLSARTINYLQKCLGSRDFFKFWETTRAALAIGFNPHTHRKTCGNPHRISIPTESRNPPYPYPTPQTHSPDLELEI